MRSSQFFFPIISSLNFVKLLQVAHWLNIVLLYYATLYNKWLCILANKEFYSILFKTDSQKTLPHRISVAKVNMLTLRNGAIITRWMRRYRHHVPRSTDSKNASSIYPFPLAALIDDSGVIFVNGTTSKIRWSIPVWVSYDTNKHQTQHYVAILVLLSNLLASVECTKLLELEPILNQPLN